MLKFESIGTWSLKCLHIFVLCRLYIKYITCIIFTNFVNILPMYSNKTDDPEFYYNAFFYFDGIPGREQKL